MVDLSGAGPGPGPGPEPGADASGPVPGSGPAAAAAAAAAADEGPAPLRALLRRRLRSVLAGSNELLAGLSTRLESALSRASASATGSGSGSDSHSLGDDDDGVTTSSGGRAGSGTGTDASEHPPHAHMFRKLRLPQLGHALSFEDYSALARHRRRKDRAGSMAGAAAAAADARSRSSASSAGGGGGGEQPEPQPPPEPEQEQQQQQQAQEPAGPDPYDKLRYRAEAPSSGSASDQDGYGPSTSLDSDPAGRKYWVRSGSEGSVQSWASSLSYESQSDEATAEAVHFMRTFVSELFTDCSAIPLERKSRFGQLAQNEAGRLWFARFVNAQRVQRKRVDEGTFYGLVQYFAIALFECADADDFSPAKSLMNMCFTFYHEVDVPGCEPYREYLYTYLRDQPIWHSLRFWNAAFFDALQCERVHRPVATRDEVQSNSLQALTDEQQYQENITFGQLGTFTYNMHAFGLSKELCSEFLRKQCVIANLSEDQEKMLRDNVDRMYRETDPWR